MDYQTHAIYHSYIYRLTYNQRDQKKPYRGQPTHFK